MKTWYQKSGYENVKLCRNNKTYGKRIHRLVAEAFLPNPLNLPEVNHKNHNPKDNRLENLEWCTRKENLYDSYKTMSQVRNYIRVDLFDKNDVLVASFQSKKAAARFVRDNFGGSYTSLLRNSKVKQGYYIREKCND